ncbi:MAG: DHA2 family efflux MFS transporter permease subunit [Spongiibacteraceae bacterium]
MKSATNPSPKLLATAVILGVLSTSFSAIFLNIALPTMIKELHIEASHSHWIVSVFITSSTLSMLLVSSLISQFSLRNTFIGSLLLFIAASLIGASLNTLWPIIVCRALQGTAMGVLSVVALITLFECYPIEKRGHAGAVFGLGVAMGPTLGPTLSGIIVDLWGWRATFYTPLILAISSLILCWKILPARTVNTTKKLDKAGFILLTIILFGLLGGISYLQQRHWPNQQSLVFFVMLALLLTVLWQHQKRCQQPLLLITLFRHGGFNAAAVVSFVYGMGLWGSAFFLPLYLQQAIGLSVWDTGMVMLPSGLLLCLILPLGGRMADRLPARVVVSLGLTALGSSFLLMGLEIAKTSFILLALFIAISRGLGLGIMIPSLDATATRALPSEKMNEGVAMMNFLRQLGGALSPTLLMLLLQWRISANTVLMPATIDKAMQAGYHQSLLGLGSLFMLSVLAAWRLPKQGYSTK